MLIFESPSSTFILYSAACYITMLFNVINRIMTKPITSNNQYSIVINTVAYVTAYATTIGL